MIQVMKGNRQLTIQEDQLQRYIDLGYSQIDEDGDIIRIGKPITLDDWKAYASELEASVANMTRHKEELENQLLESAEKVSIMERQLEEKPKTTRGRAAAKEAPSPEGTDQNG